jgi:hypothetical protein
VEIDTVVVKQVLKLHLFASRAELIIVEWLLVKVLATQGRLDLSPIKVALLAKSVFVQTEKHFFIATRPAANRSFVTTLAEHFIWQVTLASRLATRRLEKRKIHIDTLALKPFEVLLAANARGNRFNLPSEVGFSLQLLAFTVVLSDKKTAISSKVAPSRTLFHLRHVERLH